MGKITNDNLPDMQKSQSGFHPIGIEKVGVMGMDFLLPILMKDGSIQKVAAKVKSSCSLQEDLKGINMSRISRTINKILLEESSGNGFKDLQVFVKELKAAHNAEDIEIEAKFTLILDDKSPMTYIYSQEPVDVIFESTYKEGKYQTFLTVGSTEMSLCPCSKTMSLLVNNITDSEAEEISHLSPQLIEKIEKSGYGGHNQKSRIKAKVELNMDSETFLWVEDIRDMIRQSSSCPSYSVLKRSDEKFVTEVSYMGGYIDDNKEFVKVEGNYGPKFVEDISRDFAYQLNKELDHTILDYILECCNEESIHSSTIEAFSIITAHRNLIKF